MNRYSMATNQNLKNKFKEWIKIRRVKFINNIWVKGMIIEEKEYEESFKILKRYSKTKKITKEEIEILHTQLWDTLKITGMSLIFILPGGSFFLIGLIFLCKKTGWHLLPSVFKI